MEIRIQLHNSKNFTVSKSANMLYARVLKNVLQLKTAGASYREVSTSVGNVLTAVSHYFYMTLLF